MLFCVHSTNVRIDIHTRAELERLAKRHGVTVGRAATLAVRVLRQESMGTELAQPLSDDERTWLEAELG
jgi:hypothetical protein